MVVIDLTIVVAFPGESRTGSIFILIVLHDQTELVTLLQCNIIIIIIINHHHHNHHQLQSSFHHQLINRHSNISNDNVLQLYCRYD